jgi:hypothetical protein
MTKQTKNILIFGGLLGLAYVVIRMFNKTQEKNMAIDVQNPTMPKEADGGIEIRGGKKYKSLNRLQPKDFPIKKGSKGYEIGLLQEKAGMTDIEQDGIWGVKTEQVIQRVFGKNTFTLKEYNDAISSQVFGGKTIFQQAQEQQQNTRNLNDKLNLKF